MISVEAGDWPPEATLEDLSRRAVAAAVEALEMAPPAPLPNPASPLQAARDAGGTPELSIVFTDDAAMRKLNFRWREKDAPTNVLSFPQAAGPLLGDVILSAETLRREAGLADKALEDHMAHLIIHGYLHLLGFDHEAPADAEKMEQLERVALNVLGISDPYAAAS